MKKYSMLCVLAALLLLAAPSVVPVPAHACNILNPPIACGNVPGGNPVQGLGVRFETQFQGVPGTRPGGGDDPFFVDDPWQLNDRWEFPSASPGNGPGESVVPRQDREVATNNELERIKGGYRADPEAITDPELRADIGALAAKLVARDAASRELEEYDRNGGLFESGGSAGTLGSPDNNPDPVGQSDNADIEDGHDSIMDEIESVIVKM